MKMVKKKTLSLRVVLVFILSLVLAPLSSITAFATGTFTSHSYNGRTYKLYVPSGYKSGTSTPLVVMLHGCTQDPDQFASGTGMNELAETENFLVLYPQQTSSANQNACWNWFDTAHQSRGSGEPALITGMVNEVKSKYSVDNNKVFVTGLSAGAAMSVILGATYPDVFKAIGVGSGLEYKAATSMTAAFTAMNTGGPDPKTQGRLAYQAMGSYKKVVPTIVFHGTSDYTVATINGNQVLSQWATTNDFADDGSENGTIDDIADQTIQGQASGSQGRKYTRYVYNDNNGNVVMEKYLVDGMGHAWSGGNTSGSYTDPNGPNQTQITWNFFKSVSGGINPPTDTTAPITTANPTSGTYSSPVTVTLTANESADTYYTTDGSDPSLNSTKYVEPITINSNTILKFFSIDAAGNSEAVKTETYTIESNSNYITLNSIDSEDGYIGVYAADGYSTSTLKIGDKGMYNTNTYYSILSFDTSSLEATNIQSAKLRIYRKSLSGNVAGIKIDIKSGYFGTSSTLTQSDYGANASIVDVVTMNVPSRNNEYVEVELPSTALNYINKTGKTQFRLKGISSADFTSDILEIYGGDNIQYSPKLIITPN